MWAVYTYQALTLTVCGYAIARGGAPERIGAIIALIGTAAFFIEAPVGHRSFRGVEIDIFLEDVIVLAAFQLLAAWADRFWTMWAAGLQLATVMVHVSRIAAVDVFPIGYAIGAQAWSVMIVLLICAGTHRHRRRLIAFGEDVDWTFQRYLHPWQQR